MATIRTRRRKDGSLAYLSEIRVKRDGVLLHRESKTFDRLGKARAWAATREKSRSRRPTPDELDALTGFFEKRDRRRSNIPINDIMWLTIHSARRQGEITELLFSDNDHKFQTGVVRDLKHPTERDRVRRFKYTPEAWEIICRQDHDEDRVFPVEPRSIGSAFRQACKLLEIHDLHFHDLRHEATSRLFESGYSIVEVQQFTLHDSWGTLSKYTHLRPELVKIRNSNRQHRR